jgi:uncharacterized MAPEG superfamily protein
MTLATWCVLVAAILPYLFIGFAKADPRYLKGGHNKNPREYEEALHGARKRAYWAQLNGFEAFPPFAAAVIIAHIAGAEQSTVDLLAVVFIVARLLHGVLYIADQDRLRSLAWAVGIACVVGLFVVAAG